MSKEAAEFQTAVADLEDALRRAIRAFAEWFAAEWKITPEQWRHDCADDPPGGPEWFAGHDAGVDSAVAAADAFLDDYLSR